MNENFGKQVIITGDVKYVGEGEDPAENIYMKAYANALKEVYGQPERLNLEDRFTPFGKALVAKMDNQLRELMCDSPNTTNK